MVKDKIENPLTPAQTHVLRGMAQGMNVNAIAGSLPDDMRIGVNGVLYHCKQIFLKLEVNNRVSAVLKAKEMGIL